MEAKMKLNKEEKHERYIERCELVDRLSQYWKLCFACDHKDTFDKCNFEVYSDKIRDIEKELYKEKRKLYMMFKGRSNYPSYYHKKNKTPKIRSYKEYQHNYYLTVVKPKRQAERKKLK